MNIVGDIDFNRQDDKEEFSTGDKVIWVNRFKREESHRVGFSLELGRKHADILYLTFELAELLTAIARCEED